MKEIRKKQVADLLSKLNEIYLAEYGQEFAYVEFKGNRLFIQAASRHARIALELFMHGFKDMSVYSDGIGKLDIWFR